MWRRSSLMFVAERKLEPQKSPGAKLFLPTTYLLCQSTYSSTFSTSSFIIKGKTAEVNWILPDHPGRFLQWKKNSICRTMSCHLFPSNSYFCVSRLCSFWNETLQFMSTKSQLTSTQPVYEISYLFSENCFGVWIIWIYVVSLAYIVHVGYNNMAFL